jgi:predicted transposase/invertase (TIGR01784 family)
MVPQKHIRFDWAAKKLLRDKKNFGILEGFLSELLKDDIKIEGLLESEANQEAENEKYNRVDLFAENSKGEHIIIEVQNSRELDYLMRMLFGTSKAVSEYLKVGNPYSEIKKVIAVSIIYFGLGKGDDYVYIGQTKFKGLHSKVELQLTKAQQELLKKPTIHEAFPEYYLIQTTKFKDVIKEPLDEWIYFFKNNEVLDGFRAKGMQEVREKLAIHIMSDTDRRQYNRFLNNLHSEASIAETLRIETEAKRLFDLAREELVQEKKEFTQEKSELVQERKRVEDEKKGIEDEKKGIEDEKKRLENERKELEEKAKENEDKVAKEKEDSLKALVLKCIKRGDSNEDIMEIIAVTIEIIEQLRKNIS